VDLSFLTFLAFIGTIAAMVQIVEMAIDKFAPALYAALGVFLPLIAVNCAILGASLFMGSATTPGREAVFGFGSGSAGCSPSSASPRFARSCVQQRSPAAARPRHHLHRHRPDGDGLHGLRRASSCEEGGMGMTDRSSAGVAAFTFVVLALVIILMVAGRAGAAGRRHHRGQRRPGARHHTRRGRRCSTRCSPTTRSSSLRVRRKGHCGVCKVEVCEGGGALLPTERRTSAAARPARALRLSCQVKVKEDMKIEVDEEVFGVKKWKCTVRSNDNVATFIKELVLELPEGESVPFRAGGYIQIACPPHMSSTTPTSTSPSEFREDWDKFNMWEYVSRGERAGVSAPTRWRTTREEKGIIMLNVRIASPPPRMPRACRPA
jgi:hypothetical protein